MGAKDLSNYLEGKDKFGQKVKDWATQTAPGIAECKVCVPSARVKFEKGKRELLNHSESAKHRKHFSGLNNNIQRQQSVTEMLAQNSDKSEVNEKARELEIAIVQTFSRHGIPPENTECITAMLKKYIPDSEIVKKVKLGRTKAAYLTTFGVGDTFEKETVKKLQKCDAFSIQIDESEVNKVSQLEIRANIASSDVGIERRHFKVLDLEAGDATTITDTVIEAFEEDNIDIRSKLIDIGMDGCSTMQGRKGGVITKMMKEIPQLRSTGSCNSHNLANAMKHASDKFDPDIKLALVDLYQDIGGAKGKGLKKKKEFEATAKSMGLEPKPIKRFVETRFRTLLICITPILDNYLAIVKYYKTLKKPTERQCRLRAFFVDREDKSRLELKFLLGATEDLTAAIDFFEQQQAHVHNTRVKLEEILVRQLGKIVDDKYLNNLTISDELVRKPIKEIVDLDMDEVEVLSNKKVFIGQEVVKELQGLGLTPNSVQIKWFYEKVKMFHITAVEYLQKYFKLALNDDAMENMTGLDPKKQMHFLTPRKLNSLSIQYSKVVDNIEPFGGLNKIQEEIKSYVVDEEVKEIEKKNYEIFWKAVQSLKEGNWRKYEVLPRFALSMGTKNSATGDVERGFSSMNLIHQNRQRNSMSQDTLDAHLHIRAGVECEENINKCQKCEGVSYDHCHCSLSVISEEMKFNCKKAREKCMMAQREASAQREHAKESNVEKFNEAVAGEKERIQKLKEKLSTKSDFLPSSLMVPVYGKKDKGVDEGKGKGDKKAVTENGKKNKSDKAGHLEDDGKGKGDKKAVTENGKKNKSDKAGHLEDDGKGKGDKKAVTENGRRTMGVKVGFLAGNLGPSISKKKGSGTDVSAAAKKQRKH